MSFFPIPCSYAVLEIDVEKTLRGLNDPSATAAGAAIRTTKCLVYLDRILTIPGPDYAAFKYLVQVVGPRLRPEVPTRDLLPDMCAPIYPNTRHPLVDRAPLTPSPPFPFANCYHWFGPDVVMDVRVRNDGRDFHKAEGTMLPTRQQIALDCLRTTDLRRSARARADRDGTPMPVFWSYQPLDAQAADPSAVAPREGDSSAMNPCTEQCCHAAEQDDADCDQEWHYDPSCSSIYVPSDGGCSFECPDDSDVPCGDVFGLDYNDKDKLLPVVQLWDDIGAHFKEEEVPDPLEFIKQYDEVVRCVTRASTRYKFRFCD
ncbi:hypothetical protein C2E23DRAFT_743997 [Lenzites betulinus]|nr:hypothetical protein C2E23DRAFT_743997 [Lenzites betulinus]